jgi:hypothetical protein
VPLLFLLLIDGDDAGHQAAVVQLDRQLAGKAAAFENPPARQHRLASQRQAPAIGLVSDGHFVQAESPLR